MYSAKIMRKERLLSANYDFFFSTHTSQSKFCFIIHLLLITFALANLTDKASEIGTLERGLIALDDIINRAHAIENELDRLQVMSNSMALKVCREVVSNSIQQFTDVQNTMSSIMMSSDQATMTKMAVTTANTYLRTCQKALDEVGENRHGQFGTVISLLAAAVGDECTRSQIIDQAITEIGEDPPKKDKHLVMEAVPGSIIASIPATRRVRVAKDGSGNYTTINDAVQNVPINQNSYFLISIEEGMYQEYINISSDRPYIILVGAGEGKTIITGNRSNATGYGTYYSATLAIEAQYFIGFNFTVENTAGPQRYQAVALRTTGSFSAFYHCTISGFQDTLFVHVGYQFFRECTITGTIDFIFGDSSVVFQNCTIVLRQPLEGQENVITASNRNCPTDPTGISVHMSNIIAAPDLRNTTVSYLGRPWGDYARTAFLLSGFSVSIDPSRWVSMNGSPANVEFGEFRNFGLAGGTNMSAPNMTFDHELNKNSAYQFSVGRMLMGGNWIGNMTVPYTKGLLQY